MKQPRPLDAGIMMGVFAIGLFIRVAVVALTQFVGLYGQDAYALRPSP